MNIISILNSAGNTLNRLFFGLISFTPTTIGFSLCIRAFKRSILFVSTSAFVYIIFNLFRKFPSASLSIVLRFSAFKIFCVSLLLPVLVSSVFPVMNSIMLTFPLFDLLGTCCRIVPAGDKGLIKCNQLLN